MEVRIKMNACRGSEEVTERDGREIELEMSVSSEETREKPM